MSLQRTRTSQRSNLRCSIGERKKEMLPVTGAEWQWRIRGTLAGALVACHLLGRRERDWGFWLEEEEGSKESYGR